MARRAGRPADTILTRERIFDAALELVDREGVDGLTVTSLAKELGVSGPSIYHHVDGRGEIVEGVRHLVVAETDVTPFSAMPWAPALAAWARSLRDAFGRHPHTIPLLATTTIRSELTLQMYERAVESLEEAGWPEHLVVGVFTAVESFVVGSALDLAAPDTMIDIGGHTEHVPRLARALERRETSPRADEAFEIGLTALVAGLEQRLAQERAVPSGHPATATPAGRAGAPTRTGGRRSRQGAARSS
jgi:AcrR family transcriptional regulator